MIKKLKYIDIKYSNNDLDYIDDISKEIDLKSQNIVDFFGLHNYQERFQVNIINDLNHFKNLFKDILKKNPDNWVCGFSYLNDSYVLSFKEYIKTSSHENDTIMDMIKLILHEFVHSVYMTINSNLKYKWLTEGIATYLTNQYENAKYITCTYKELLNGCSYSNYKIMFSYVIDTYGEDYIFSLINDNELLEKETKKLYDEAINYGNYKTKLIDNIDKIHTTDLGKKRIKNNLGISSDDVIAFLKHKIISKQSRVFKKGKNYYCEVDNIIITINYSNYSVITAHERKLNNMQKVIKKGIYKHFKGDLYLVEDIAYHSEDKKRMVIYRALYGDTKLWCRPYKEFLEEVNRNGQKYRFELQKIERLNK